MGSFCQSLSLTLKCKYPLSIILWLKKNLSNNRVFKTSLQREHGGWSHTLRLSSKIVYILVYKIYIKLFKECHKADRFKVSARKRSERYHWKWTCADILLWFFFFRILLDLPRYAKTEAKGTSSFTFETAFKSGEKAFLPKLLMDASDVGNILNELILYV